jgi:hypothetical protein
VTPVWADWLIIEDYIQFSKEYANPDANASRPIWPIDCAKRPIYCFSLPAD